MDGALASCACNVFKKVFDPLAVFNTVNAPLTQRTVCKGWVDGELPQAKI